MKNLIVLMFLSGAVLTACQSNVTIPVNALNENAVEISPLISLTPTPSLTPKPKEEFDIHSKIGIVDVHSDDSDKPSCLRTKNGNLVEKTPVSIIISLDEPPQKVLKAVVGKKVDSSCVRRFSEAGDDNPGENYFYTLNLTEKLPDMFFIFGVGIAVIDPPKPIQVQNNLASIDLNEDGKPEFFRKCNSSEGGHFTIWTGKPLKGKRIWHSYYYVDYDTVPTCQKKDWEELED